MNRNKSKSKKDKKNMSSAASGDCVDYTQRVVDQLEFQQLLSEYERVKKEAAERQTKEKEATERLRAEFAHRLEESEGRVQKLVDENERLLLKLNALSRHGKTWFNGFNKADEWINGENLIRTFANLLERSTLLYAI
jgi:hypothetical protein